LVLADRGFTVHESVQFQQAKLNIPAFTKGKDQLDSADVEQTRRLLLARYMSKEYNYWFTETEIYHSSINFAN
jgi:hypothetical protein